MLRPPPQHLDAIKISGRWSFLLVS
ncbi:hypothetical protein VCPCS023_001779, partial [Vibrio cholerae O1 str. PCS-023]